MSIRGEAALPGGDIVVPNRGAGLIKPEKLAEHRLPITMLENLLKMPVKDYWRIFDYICPSGQEFSLRTGNSQVRLDHTIDRRYGLPDVVRSASVGNRTLAFICLPEVDLVVGESHPDMTGFRDSLEPQHPAILDRGDVRFFTHIPAWAHYQEVAALLGHLVQ